MSSSRLPQPISSLVVALGGHDCCEKLERKNLVLDSSELTTQNARGARVPPCGAGAPAHATSEVPVRERWIAWPLFTIFERRRETGARVAWRQSGLPFQLRLWRVW